MFVMGRFERNYLIMKIANKLVVASSLLIAAGCSHREKHVSYNEGYSAPTYGAGTSSYNSSSTYNSSTAVTPGASSTITTTPGTTTTVPGTTSLPEGTDSGLVTQVQQAIGNDPVLTSVAPNIQV